MRIAPVALLLSLALVSACGQQRIEGRYAADDGIPLTLTIAEAADGAISGTLTGPTDSAPLVGRRTGDGLAGTAGTGEDASAFTATLEDDQRLAISFGSSEAGQTIRFHRLGDGESPPPATP